MTSNPIVAQPEDSTRWYTGLGLAESVNDLSDGIESGSWVDGTLGGVGLALDGLGLILDPVGSVAAWGVAWLIEHVQPLSDALDALAGDPDQISANATTWKNVAFQLHTAAEGLRDAVIADIAEWSGPAAQAYRFQAQEQLDVLAAISRGSQAIGTGVHLAGALVGAVREFVRDLISECIATLAVRLPMWLAEVGLTLGIGTPWVAGQVAALVAKWVKRIASILEALISSFRKLSPLLRRLDDLIESLKDLLRRMTHSGPTDPNPPRGRDADGDGTPDAFDPDQLVAGPLHRDDPLPTEPMADSRYQYETDPDDPRNPFYRWPPPGRNQVERWSPEVLEQHRVVVGPDGLLRRTDGTLFDTSSGTSAHSSDGRAIFIMDEHGNVYATNSQQVGRVHHSTLAGGDSVVGAGELKVTDGRLEILSNESGHYSPSKTQTRNVVEELRRQGLSISEDQVQINPRSRE